MLMRAMEAGANSADRIESEAPEDLRTSLSHLSRRLRHAAELADISSSGEEPEAGACLVLAVLEDLAPTLRVLSRAAECDSDS